MLPVLTLGSVGTALVGLASAFFAPGEATSRPAPQDPAPATKPAEPPAIVPAPALNLEDTEGARDARPKLSPEAQAEQFRAIRAEYDALWDNANEKAKAGKNEAEQGQIRASLRPDEVKFARRMMDLAIVDPKSKVARDAAIWVMDKTWMSDVGYNGSEFEAAVGLLVHNHADDPEAVRVGLQLNSAPSRRREEFVEGCYANATSREAKGLARLAYAQYLEKMVPSVRAAIKHPERNVIHFTRHDENGKLVPTSIPEPNGEFAYKVGLRRLDPDALRAEAERLYQEVIAEYGDIPYITRGTRRLEAELVRPLPADATAKDRLERAGIEQMLQRKSTLADAARARLRGMNELRVGVPAPGFDKVDVRTGRPIRLADLRGTVVYLFPWSDRGDEMRDIVERVKAAERRERERGRPFAAIGLVGGETKEAARAMIERNGVEWLNIFEPDRVESGSVARAYQVRGYTDTYLIDREGRIARRQVVGRNLAEALDRLAEPPKAP